MTPLEKLGDDDAHTLSHPSVLTSQIIAQARVFKVRQDRLSLPDGKESTFVAVIHPGAVVVIPQLEDGRYLLVRQYRHALGREIYEFPAGTLEVGEDPLVCAKRELTEEVGHAAQVWLSLGTQYPAPGFCNELQHCFLARSLTPQTAPHDDDEILTVIKATSLEIEEAIRDGRMVDAKSLAIYLKLKLADPLVE